MEIHGTWLMSNLVSFPSFRDKCLTVVGSGGIEGLKTIIFPHSTRNSSSNHLLCAPSLYSFMDYFFIYFL